MISTYIFASLFNIKILDILNIEKTTPSIEANNKETIDTFVVRISAVKNDG
jgi:hypothetical protein